MPSPQRRSVQPVRQAASGAFEFAAPLSHCSPNALSTTVSPHFCDWQLVRHVALGLFELSPPASHCSPLIGSITPLPQVSFDLQSAEQPSPETVLPSSQTSPFVLSRMPSPQRCGMQLMRHAAFGALLLEAPASQTSPRVVSMI